MDRQTGLTLIEMMITVAILAIILSIATPAFTDMLNKQRLNGAADNIFSELQLARSDAIKRNAPISLSFTANGSSAWCFALTDTPPCNCATDGACTIAGTASKVTSSSDFKDVTLAYSRGTDRITFSPPRGTTNDNGTFTLTADGTNYTVVVDSLGFPNINKQ